MSTNTLLSQNIGLLSDVDLCTMSSDDVLALIEMNRQKYLSMHKAPITQGKGAEKRWATSVPDATKASGRRTIRKKTKEEVENELIKYYKEQEAVAKRNTVSMNITLAECFPKWIEYASQRPKIASETVRRYRNDYKRFIQNSEFGKMKVKRIDYIDVEEFLISEVQRLNLKVKALNNLFGYLKGTFKYAMRQRITQENPCDLVDMKTVRAYCNTSEKTAAERTLSEAESNALLDRLHEHQTEYPLYMADYAIEICTHTGLRVGEVAVLRWDCIRNGELHITQSEHRIDHDDLPSTYEIGLTKNSKERRVPISAELEKVFEKIRLLQQEHHICSEYIIADLKGRIIAPTISKAMYRRGVEAGIQAKSIHAIRRTVSSRLRTELPRATVALIMGHTEEVNDEHYNYDTLSLERKKEIMSKLLTTTN